MHKDADEVPDMGSGHFPWEGYQKAAYMNQLAVQTSPTGTMSKYNPQTIYATNPWCYGIVPNFANTGSWGPYLLLGRNGYGHGIHTSLPPVKLNVLGKDETSSSTRSGGDRCSSRRAASTAA